MNKLFCMLTVVVIVGIKTYIIHRTTLRGKKSSILYIVVNISIIDPGGQEFNKLERTLQKMVLSDALYLEETQ